MFYVYLMRCKDGTLYCGSTKDLAKREERHNTGRGAVYTKIRGGGKIVYTETYLSLGDALRREMQIKKFKRAKKESLIARSARKNA